MQSFRHMGLQIKISDIDKMTIVIKSSVIYPKSECKDLLVFSHHMLFLNFEQNFFAIFLLIY